MRREVSLEEISDGRLYELNDMVKADCRIVQDVMTAVREWGIQLCWIHGCVPACATNHGKNTAGTGKHR